MLIYVYITVILHIQELLNPSQAIFSCSFRVHGIILFYFRQPIKMRSIYFLRRRTTVTRAEKKNGKNNLANY